MKRNVFISKSEAEIVALKKQLPTTLDLIAHSFLTFSPVSFSIEQPFDIVFFGSPRSVLFYTAYANIPKGTKIACIGNKTAELLRELNYTPSYIFDRPGNPKQGVDAFKTWCDGKSILFPISNQSLKSVSSAFPDNQKQEVVVYNTILNQQKIPLCDVYIFTSPSNVKGFLQTNEIQSSSNVISWGKSTSNALIDNGISISHELESASQEELLELLS